jgi:hypothetical protein
MRKSADPYLRKAAVVLGMTAVCMAVGCSSDPAPKPEDLSPVKASTLITQKWAHDQLNHFAVSFHSDTLIGCGIQNDLWKHVQVPYNGFTIDTYQLTEAGRKALFAIDLKDSGKFHEVTLQGPYLVEVTGIAPGSQPDLRQVTIRWEIDWNKAPAALKACLPRFELSGSQVALFKLSDQEWSFLSFLDPADLTAAPQAADPALAPILRQ